MSYFRFSKNSVHSCARRNMMWNILILVIAFLAKLAIINGLNGKTVDSVNHAKRGLYFGHMISCETGRSFLDYLDYGCYCGLGGSGTPVDDLDTCCLTHDKCYGDLITNRICRLRVSTYTITYKYDGCSQCAEPHEYSWWDKFGHESVTCRRALCECDAVAARCFKNSKFNKHFKHYNQAKC